MRLIVRRESMSFVRLSVILMRFLYVGVVVRCHRHLSSHQSAAGSNASPGWELGVSDESVLVSLGSHQHDHRQASLRPHYCQGRATSRRHQAFSTCKRSDVYSLHLNA